jgi:putative nucleotidyltransferase with HDIG domain
MIRRDSRTVVYQWTVMAMGACALIVAIWTTAWTSVDYRWAVLCTLTVLSAVATLRMKSAPISFSIADAFTFATLLLLGPGPATLTAALEAFTISSLLSPEQRRLGRTLFNVAAVSLAMSAAGSVVGGFVHITGSQPLTTGWLILATTAGSITYFLTNTGTVAIAVALEQQRPPAEIWRTHFIRFGLTYGAGAYTALLLVLMTPGLNSLEFMLLAPSPLALYAAMRMWIGRINDHVSHLDSINRQYRATIDALAHAVDAKDQVTHGHLRRVQATCVHLARALGCTDPSQLHALEAASLLHDLGKLAIPEHILNKPGKLSPAEYATMKTHAEIGAEILSGIEFPFPVVPIVRHHHENWDGSGYPAGLAGEEIPLGARILAVADCFDALTSDRPYRRAMRRLEALDILVERRGTMYDPKVVDEFLEIVDSIDTLEVSASAADDSPAGVAFAAVRNMPRQAALHENSAIASTAAPILAAACRITPATAGIVFVPDEGTDRLTPVASIGLPIEAVHSVDVRIGERLSGWVAASRRAQYDSDAQLDLAGNHGQLRGAASMPVEQDGKVVAVLTLYANDRYAFVPTATPVLNGLAATLADIPRLSSSSASRRICA